MTNSLYENIQALGNRMVTNLNSMGVSAEFSDGGLTLADKILQVNQFKSGLLLSADKSIDQSSNTINFTAVYMDNGNVVSGKSINFYGLKEATSTSKSLTADTWTPVGCKFGVSADSSTTGILYLTQDSSSVDIVAASGNLIVNIPNKSPYSGVSNIVFEDGILSFTQNGSTVTEDLSSYDCTNVKATVSGFTIADYGVFDTTDSNGVATATYTCSGAGKRTVVAKCDLLQETYEVLDCYRYDEGLLAEGHHNDIWTGISNTDLTRETGYTTIKEKTVGTTATITFTGIPLTDYRIEVDVFQVDGNSDEWFITVLNEDYSPISDANSKLNEWKHISLDITNASINSRIRLNTGGTCTETRFKNFKLYPI